MSTTPQAEFNTIKGTCLTKFQSKELWPSYYERRHLEFLTFFEMLPKKKYVKILELGCGIGYYSAFLSKISDEVIATDLETIDPLTHSPGLQITRDFLTDLGMTNVVVMHASAEDLPFEDNTFDLVFSSHVIEHVPNVNKAIHEINRVLKPGGINFCVVPTTTDRLYGFFTFYIYLFVRVFSKIFKKLAPKKRKVVTNGQQSASQTISNFRFYFQHFPFPPPHGIYPSYMTEVKKWTLGSWKRILTQNQSIKFVSQFGLQSNPFLPILGNIFPFLGVRMYAFTRTLENKLGKLPFFKYFGISTLIITEKTVLPNNN